MGKIIELDVREDLQKKIEPFQKIMNAIRFKPQLSFIPGLLLVIGLILFFVQMFMTLRKQSKKNIKTLFVSSALVCLLLTIVLGLALAFHFFSGTEILNHLFLLKAHLLFGISGWFTLLIIGFSYKMAPMFSLAHGFSMKPARYVYIFYMSGLIIAFFSFLKNDDALLPVGIILLFIGFALFVYHMFSILQKKVKKKLDRPFLFALLAIGIAFFLHLAAVFLSFDTHLYGFAILLYGYIFGWIILSIIGYLYKIVPFLWWTHRYCKKIGKENAPTLKQMMNEKWAVLQCCLFILSLTGVACAFILSSLSLFYFAQVGMVLFSLLFANSILSVLFK
ncbi:hypothetical protein PB1_04815 [Bacillus methanolicus PB1]|uniref:Uncharacterized protein n=1 Tax=Bacillus methanolicus PB1 TaxID=997296 RepID=I3E6V4_BACMT|nr:hypothetical protein [Bacillus methanolicus]EIJ82225.1 hypothetical protein PB1_04815 [Bacillus methanolicus PB1]